MKNLRIARNKFSVVFKYKKFCRYGSSLWKFPAECKIVKLKPLFKKDSKTNLKNCRPILLLPVVWKIIEKSIHYQLEDYLFKMAYSTNISQALKQIFNWFVPSTAHRFCFIRHRLENAYWYDLERPPEGFQHTPPQNSSRRDDMSWLQKKQKTKKTVIKWFEPYLSSRKFFVSVGDISSEGRTLNFGVPQEYI